ncbi:PP2C family protein-serine/threonine phosphatase [Actinomadura parmotrematis]|uniref:Serine/threonine-protein phosphatase n=1 Tax=Actinomadura parmotrematis TaxID=2864039 RepID=A0ABS7FNR7_9ACTN|nr:PP2C family protein-serine/threonine phosphatase [Actinomadura parmotrematis]MBW8482024.1 serine/threonine-protein phosphatase [Actinomadura parmotrematis]
MQSTAVHDVEHVIWSAQPHELLDAATAAIVRYAGAAGAEVLLADYRQARLVPSALDRPPVAVDGTDAGHAFAAQAVVTAADGRTLHLPLTVHGDRVGVLTVAFGDPPDAGLRARLAALATVLGRAVKLAEAQTDLFRRIRRRARLTLAAEMQWDLLPGRSCTAAEFQLAGQLEPAYAVWGDNFDWSVTGDRLTLSVSNGMGSGTEAAALTHLAISALRNARRSGADLPEQAALADQTVYAHHRGDRHVATLLMDVDLATGRARAVDAGSPRVYRLRGGRTEAVTFEEQLPLGMFGDSPYETEAFAVEPGDRLVVVSDGVHAARSAGGALYGDEPLARALRDTRLQNPPEAVRSLLRRFGDHHGGAEQADDAVIVCLDWTGRP